MSVLNTIIEIASTGYRHLRYIFIDDDNNHNNNGPLFGLRNHEYRSLGSGFEDFTHSREVIRLIIFHGLCYFAFAILGFSFLVDNWSILDSMYFASVVFTTIGYGDMAPDSQAGRIYTMLLALYGIVILGIFLGVIGEIIVEYQHSAVEERKEINRQQLMEKLKSTNPNESVPAQTALQDLDRHERSLMNNDSNNNNNQSESLAQVILNIIRLELPVVGVLLVVALWVGYMEGWSIDGSIYWLVVTGTTVGFGDYHPTLPTTRFFCIFFLPMAVAVLGKLLARIASAYMDRKVRKQEKEFLSRSLALFDLRVMDTDVDGKVDLAEFMTYMLVALQKVSKDDVREIRQVFQKLDVDGSGFLTVNDLEMTMKDSINEVYHTS